MRPSPRLAAALVLPLALACGRAEQDRIVAHGTIEVTEVDVAPMVPARVVRVWVDEGDPVRAGDTLVSLTQSTTRADIDQQRARVGAAEAVLREAVAGPRRQEIERAQAEVAATEAEAARAQRDLERIIPLAESRAVAAQALDAARAQADATRARRDAARQALRLLQAGTRPERVQAARAELGTARAALAAAEAVAGDLVLLAPVDGSVLVRAAEPGEVLAAGRTALILGETGRPYTRVYVSSLALPRVRAGQTARATLDGLPGRSFAGRVVAIDDRAQFTPRIALTEDERADLMFGVKVMLADSGGVLKAGLPATVEFASRDAR